MGMLSKCPLCGKRQSGRNKYCSACGSLIRVKVEPPVKDDEESIFSFSMRIDGFSWLLIIIVIFIIVSVIKDYGVR
jgi:uncharacterized membrane protein YvbJ